MATKQKTQERSLGKIASWFGGVFAKATNIKPGRPGGQPTLNKGQQNTNNQFQSDD